MVKDLLIGQQLGNFRVERLIGRGGMAQVYYGWDVKLQRPVAIKVIDARYRDSLAYAARFVREARAVATWRHEHIIQVYHADEQEGLYYFVMEHVDGLDLGAIFSQYTAEGALMPHDDVLRIGRAIAAALDYAHQEGVIHRDVKPSNVMVTGDGRVILTDFGLAMDVQQGSLGEVFGSPHYIAPEQARRSADAVPQSDLYSLGVILYEMLTGVVPFDDPSSTSVALQHVTLPPPPPRELNPALDEKTAAVLLKALSKAPAERYQTGAELLDALAKALAAGEPALEGPTQPLRSVDERVTRYLQASAEPAPPRDARLATRGTDLLEQQLDEYLIEALLGQGGMACVYRGLDVRLQRYVAIKVIDTPFRTDSDYIMRFEREARAIAKLEHPYVVRLYRYGEANDLLYMAMQYVDGADLGTVLDSYRRDREFIEPQDARRIIREICQALDYAHEQGVIHRDVKPSNVMLDKQGHAILTDFGLALLTEAGTRGLIFGSPHYIAPEQAISSANVTPQSDLYAVGVILYQLFTGELPFDAEDPLDVAMLHMTASPRPPRELRPDISPELEAVILKAMAQEPKDRYASGAELAAALDQACQVKEPTPTRATAARLSVLERVEVELAEHPLPPIPAAVATPTPREAGPGTAVAAPAPPPAAPAAVGATPASEWSASEAAGAIPVPRPAAPPAVPRPGAPSGPSRRLIIYAGIGIGACMLSSILLLALFLLLGRGDENGAQAEDQTAATVAVGESQATADGDSAPTATPAATSAPGPTSEPTATPAPSPTSEPAAVAATPTAPPPTPTIVVEGPANYRLLIEYDEDSLFVINQATAALPLAPLRLGDDKNAVDGIDWGLDTLANGQCVAVWKDKDESRLPEGLECDPVGESLTRGGKDRFWKETFNVYFGGEQVGTCEKDRPECPVDIPIRDSYYLLFARRGGDGLFLVNWTTKDFPLEPLRLGDDEGAVDGAEWARELLEQGACVAVWKNEDEPRPPDGLACSRVGERVTRSDKKEQFWKSTFDVYYQGELVGTCEKEQEKCAVNIPLE